MQTYTSIAGNAWSEAKDQVARCLRFLAEKKGGHFGPYFVDPVSSNGMFSYYRKKWDDTTIYTFTQFSLFGEGEVDGFQTLGVRSQTAEDDVWNLYASAIEERITDNNKLVFEYIWVPDETYGTQVGMGRLVHVRVTLPDRSYVSYNLNAGTRVTSRDNPLFAMAPESLVGVTELYGHQLPWQLEFRKKGYEIYQKSEIWQLARVMEQLDRGNSPSVRQNSTNSVYPLMQYDCQRPEDQEVQRYYVDVNGAIEAMLNLQTMEPTDECEWLECQFATGRGVHIFGCEPYFGPQAPTHIYRDRHLYQRLEFAETASQ